MLHRPLASPSFHLHRIAAAMSARPSFRGSRGGRRSFSDHRPVVSGDSHFQSVREANFSLQNRHGRSSSSNNNGHGNSSNEYRRVYYNYDNQNNSFSSGNNNNNGGFHLQPQGQPYRPRAPFHGRPNQSAQRPQPADYRNWEFAKHPPPPHSERFIILSYNILADYLANNHRTLYWHIPRRFMSWDWRKRGILFELGLWSADIMCLQEVDKFHELEEGLKHRGYSGIWKMRTGEPIDGCAIFWRASRFKLVYDECIEFNKLGMRDNVAQVCVLESLFQNQTDKKSALSESSKGPNRVVVCNIHVLYNPRRGEIKLGQVRVLLERAQAVSKKWDNAPVVLCGDFNCVPKSPLYDFISEQKLDISEIDRDKVSGQATAEIHPAPRQFGHEDKGPSAGNMANLATNPDNSVDRKQNVAVEKSNTSESLPKTNSESQVSSDESGRGVSEKLFDGSLNSSICPQEAPVKGSHSLVESTEGGCSHDELNKGLEEEDSTHSRNSNNSLSGNLCSVSCAESLEVDISGMPSDLGGAIADPAQTSIGEPSEKSASLTSMNLDEKLAGLSLGEIDETLEETRDLGEAAEKLAELSDEGDAFPPNLDEAVLEDLLSSTSESEAIHADEPVYDPSRWTPMEIATATGNSNNTVLEHSLKLRSTYTEVQDHSGTRDPIGEPLVTSYNSRFMGTVDYIWRSEGLCTVKALAPIPKNAMQPSGGFPTKKWGSDHIALATELAFMK